jgi:hypothetical protein
LRVKDGNPGAEFKNTVTDVALADIVVPSSRHRALRPETVEQLAESMSSARGQLQSILLRPREGGGYSLVTGRHRFEAAKNLAWSHIKATIKDMDDDDAELAEIDENLIHADLSPAERALHVARRKEIYDAQPGAPKHGGDRKSAKSKSQKGNLKTFAKETAAKTGRSRTAIARDATRGSKIKVLPDIMGTSLDRGDELDALAKLPEKKQRKLADRAKAGEKVSAKELIAQPAAAGNGVDPQMSADARRAEETIENAPTTEPEPAGSEDSPASAEAEPDLEPDPEEADRAKKNERELLRRVEVKRSKGKIDLSTYQRVLALCPASALEETNEERKDRQGLVQRLLDSKGDWELTLMFEPPGKVDPNDRKTVELVAAVQLTEALNHLDRLSYEIDIASAVRGLTEFRSSDLEVLHGLVIRVAEWLGRVEHETEPPPEPSEPRDPRDPGPIPPV